MYRVTNAQVFCYCISYNCFFFFFFKQKTAYEMRISDWSSDVCSSDLFSIGKWWSSNRGRFSVARLSGVLSGWVVGCAVAAAGFVFLCEFLALILALDYQSKLTDGAAWPGVTLFNRLWLPGSFTTWLLPAALLVAGVAIVLYVNRQWQALCGGSAE